MSLHPHVRAVLLLQLFEGYRYTLASISSLFVLKEQIRL